MYIYPKFDKQSKEVSLPFAWNRKMYLGKELTIARRLIQVSSNYSRKFV